MKKLLLVTLFLCPLVSLALNPDSPVVLLKDGEIISRNSFLPDRHVSTAGVTVNYRLAPESQWLDDGWRQADISLVTTETVVEIPGPIQAVAAAYKASLEGIYGEGAVTNTALTREAVAIDLSLREDITADLGLRLATWFDILNGYWGRKEVWTFPYGETSYTVTTTEKVWSAQELTEPEE